MNPKNEPVWALVATSVIVWAAGHFGLKLDADTQALANGIVLLVGGYIARRAVTPNAKL